MKVMPATPGLGKLILSCALAASMSATLVACGDDDEPAAPQGPLVTTTSGAVRGNDGTTSQSFLGIPYAAPPVGALRWAPPAAVTAWTGEREAKQFAAHCAQPASPFGVASTSEDCLYLNVYTPKTAGPHPVMVWIHGGAFYLGLGDGYKPDALVAQNTVVVTLNYRLGALGFMSHAALAAEQGGKSGNYGLMDQQAALKWVRDNISKFGGNKDNVTIFGESAGGFSVNAHLASPGSAGLFHKAIAMSGAYPFSLGQDAPTAAQAKGATVVGATTCSATPTTACLRALPVASLLQAQMAAWPSGPIPSVDGVVLAKDVKTVFTEQTQAKVPVIQGTTHDEWRLFVAQGELANGPLTAATYLPTMQATLGPIANAAPYYPVPATADGYSVTLGAIGTDAVFACNGRLATKLLTAGGNTVYAYEFNDPTAPQTLSGTLSFKTAAAHTSELQYLFSMGGASTFTAAQKSLSDTMVGYWSRFARTGNPNGGTAPGWTAYVSAQDTFQNLAPTVAPIGTFAADHKCTTIWTPGV